MKLTRIKLLIYLLVLLIMIFGFSACSLPIIKNETDNPTENFVDNLPEAGSFLSITEAIELNIPLNEETPKYYISGIITQILDESVGHITISDTNNRHIEAKFCSGQGGQTAFSRINPIPKVGDEVTLYGVLKKVNGVNIIYRAWVEKHVVKNDDETAVSTPEPIQTYSVFFDVNGHGTTPASLNEVRALPEELPVVKSYGYEFVGWYLDEELTVLAVAGSTITANTTLYAKWTEVSEPEPTPTPETYTVTYDVNGHGEAPASLTEVTVLPEGLPVLTAEGYKFGDWYLDEGLTVVAIAGSTINQDTTLFAKWTEVSEPEPTPTPETYTVTYDVNGHGEAPASLTEVTVLPEELPVLTADGYTFDGWYLDEELTVLAVAGSTITSDTTLYAKWTENTVEHTHDFSGLWQFDETHHWHECSCGEIDTKVAHSGGEATETEKAKCVVCEKEYGELKEVTPTPVTYKVTYYNNGHGNLVDDLEGVTSLPQELPVLIAEGYEFDGWYLDEALTVLAVAGSTINEDTILFAKWIELTIGQKIQAEYDVLKAGTTTEHTTWTFEAIVVDMTATSYNSTYNSYNLKFIANVDGVLIGIYNGQVNGIYPTNIDGLAVGSKVTIIGVIAENYTMTSGTYTVDIEFSKPELSWSTTDTGTDTEEITSSVNFLMINDTHGAFLDSSAGSSIGRVDTLLDSLESSNGEYIRIHNGDAFQGSYICGETYGLPLIESLNAMEFDCFVLGNHEFDWGIDKIAQYADGDLTNGEANFPFLGANIFYKGTTTRPDWIDAYTIIEYNGIKVGIVGVIGAGQESSILTRYVEDYEFADPLSIISENVQKLRSELGCSVVVIATHDYDTTLNGKIASLNGDSSVDAIFCAHTHELINETLTRTDGVSIPVVQNYHKNVRATSVNINLNSSNEMVSAKSTVYTPANYSISSDIQTIINNYQELITESNQSLGSTSSEISKSTLGAYAVDAMLNYQFNETNFTGIDVSIINTGGVRATIASGDITRADVFEVFPFNNMVVLVNIKGSLIKSLYSQNSSYLYIDVIDSIGSYSNLEDNTIYQLAIIDYVFESTRYTQFDDLSSNDYLQTDVIMRNILISYIDNIY